MLLAHGTEELVPIDFEYAHITTRGFDLSNTLNEFGHDYDSKSPELFNLEWFPSDEIIRELLSHYTENLKEIDVILEEIKVYLPIVQLHWGYWGLIKAAEVGSDPKRIGFDYLLASYVRFKRLRDLTSL